MFAGMFLYILTAAGCQFSDNTFLRKANVLKSYSQRTAHSNLRAHIERYHLKLYLDLAEEKGWAVRLPMLPSQARLQAANEG
jgi:hypothetical protein